jgi:hypothetical protein
MDSLPAQKNCEAKMSVQDDMMHSDAIREVRARGCTAPGVAEVIVRHYGANHILSNLDKIQALGEYLATEQSDDGQAMRDILADQPYFAQSVTMPGAAAAEVPVVDLIAQAIRYVQTRGYSEETAKSIVAEHGYKRILADKADEQKTSNTWAESPSAADLDAAAETENAAPENPALQGEGQAQGS